MPTFGDWIQPDDVTEFQDLARRTWVSQANTATGALLGPGSENTGFGISQAFAQYVISGGFDEFTVQTLFLSMMARDLPPVTPDEEDWPAAATDLELEAPQGTLLSGHYSGNLLGWSGSQGGRLLLVAGEVFDPATWVSSSQHLRWLTPAELVDSGVSEVASVAPGGTTPVDLTLTSVQDVDGLGVLCVVTDSQVTGSAWSDTSEVRLSMTDWSYLYRPPRYRFVFAGRTPLRGRQRASGVMGSVPLRGRQGDMWGLRGRQNSNF